MKTFAYIRAGRVDHIASVDNEPMSGLDTVIEIPSGVTVELFDLYDIVTGLFSRPGTQPIIRFNYPVAATKTSSVTVDISVVNPADNLPVPLTGTYYIPLLNIITDTIDQMLVVPIVNGVGQVIFNVTNAGIYGIKPDLIRPRPTASFSEIPDIVIY